MVTHWMVLMLVWKSRPSVARATATMVVSRMAMMVPSTTTTLTRRTSGLRRSSDGSGEVADSWLSAVLIGLP